MVRHLQRELYRPWISFSTPLAHGVDSFRLGNLPDSFPGAAEELIHQSKNPTCISVGSQDHVHTLKIMKSSSFIRPALIFSPTERRYSWIFSTTISVISPDRIWSSTYLSQSGAHVSECSYLSASIGGTKIRNYAHWETFFDNAENSLRFISRPLISMVVAFEPSLTLTAAYFFF